MTTTATYIEPQTTADVRFTVLLNGVTKVDNCTITADIYSPKGAEIASNVSVPSDGGGTGTYTLTWLDTWTENVNQKPVEGEYLIQAVVLRAGRKRTLRYRVPVRFTDDT